MYPASFGSSSLSKVMRIQKNCFTTLPSCEHLAKENLLNSSQKTCRIICHFLLVLLSLFSFFILLGNRPDRILQVM